MLGQIHGDRRGLTLGGGHTVPRTDRVPYKWALEAYMTLLANVTPMHLIDIYIFTGNSATL